MTETPIENAHVKSIEAQGGRSLKFVVPADTGWPDRLDLLPVEPEHIEIVSRYVRFTEAKAPKKKPEPHQLRRHTELRTMGYVVNVVDRK